MVRGLGVAGGMGVGEILGKKQEGGGAYIDAWEVKETIDIYIVFCVNFCITCLVKLSLTHKKSLIIGKVTLFLTL